jgi:rRNA small subunit pseudouridine methyltransferase Nep1
VLTLILAESALETIPKELWGHPEVRSHSKRRGKSPSQMLLDRSYHHHAMRSLKDGLKRGRPDIVHLCLLAALGSPLNREGLLRLYVHTINDHVISIAPETRLPKNFNRFVGLMEDLFEHGRVPPSGEPLLTLQAKALSSLIDELKPSYIVMFDRPGEAKTVEEAVSSLAMHERPAAIVGAFPHEGFSEKALSLANEVVCVDREVLDAWVVVSRVIYEYERAIGLPRRRLGGHGGV